MSQSFGNKQKHASKNPVQRALIARFHARLCELVAARQPREILDVGCGEGYVAAALRAGGLTCPIHGIDISERAIAEARRNAPDALFRVADVASLAEAGERYDLVLMCEVLEHLPDPRGALSLLARVSRRHVVVSVPWEPFFRSLNFLRGKHLSALGNDPEHIQHWGRRDFMAFVAEQFEVQAAPAVFPWTLVAAERRR
jgi:SAM-dependent methyltransferase